MAKRSNGSTAKTSVRVSTNSAQAPVAARPATQPPVAQTPRNAAPAVSSQTVDITHEMIAQKAYDIWKSQGGSDFENWLKAERELRTDTSAWQAER